MALGMWYNKDGLKIKSKMTNEKRRKRNMATKKAKIVIENRKGRHQSGGAEKADMVLRAGAKGKGRKIQVVHFWPWSPKSVDKVEDIIFEAAQAKGYEIV